jgi:hypothetical protein
VPPTEPQALRAHRLALLGRSVDGTWSEDSFLVVGTTRATAAELGRQFGQRAIFERDHDDLLVVGCRDANVVRRAPLQIVRVPTCGALPAQTLHT